MIRLIAFDLDGTLTQHKTKLGQKSREILDRLSKKYALVMVGAGQCMRIFSQMGQYPVDIIGNYGLQYAVHNSQTHALELRRDESLPCDRESVEKRVAMLRQKYGFEEFVGENAEFHPSGCVTFPILGTKASQGDKLAFDPDRAKRRRIYAEVCETFPEYVVFVGGSSSFDMAPKPYNKYYALDLYCGEKGYSHEEVIFVGDDYGMGGNDESVYRSDFGFIRVDDYTRLEEYLKDIL